MRLQSSYSRHVPWADGESGSGAPQTHLVRHDVDALRRARRHWTGSIAVVAAILVAAGASAGGVMYSDRLSDAWHSENWAETSAAWTALFISDKAAPVRVAKLESAVVVAPAPPVQEPPRPSESQSVARLAANNYPVTTSSLGAAPAVPRDLPWLPEAEKRAEALKSNPTPPAARVAIASPEVAPITLPGASPPPAAPITSDVAPMIKRARGHIERGDIAGARLLLERASAGNDPSALMALAETYDPNMLAKWGARGLKADAGKARTLYQRAAESGVAEARARVLAVR
jgi:hypothetical protein